MQKTLLSDCYTSPIGEILWVADGDQLCFLDFAENETRARRLLKARFGEFSLTPKNNLLNMRARLANYFAADANTTTAADAFDGLDLRTAGTEFQRKVWRGLKKIPLGKVISYSQLADSIHQPRAIRAVGSANANNPIAIIIPCHRVIAADGSLGGYAGGLQRKSWLLTHEGAR